MSCTGGRRILCAPGTKSGDTSRTEFNNVQAWSKGNRMPLNMKIKTYEMFVRMTVNI